ncbi:hypothetical protein Poli38472_002860 [Pythium oligandrum]|uniref:UDP-galactose transporter n=1 Tax=Pythium oligandrum TaxID=41045 RepID=A0A8K1C5Q9_PYTOL|nr:hypothetical protein Poli38472_002860 [Pythium oligandrum]|eukprot:TMW56935.1 hypothetical protein Poli38472_002860 [Pythium oligandrum]
MAEPLMTRCHRFFTPLVVKKLVLLGLLSVQIGFQPLLMGWYAREARNVGLRVGVIEMMKLVMGLLPLVLTGQLVSEVKDWSLHTALQTTAAPALIYVLQNYLNQAAVVVLDGVTFNILNQTKIIWTALLVYLMLRRYQSRPQIVALTILCAAAVLMTTDKAKSKTPESHRVVVDEAAADAAFFTGAYQALIAAILSALAGTIIQRALQSQKRNAYLVTVELSILGELTILAWTMTTSNNGFFSKPNATPGHPTGTEVSTDSMDEHGLWYGWTFGTVFALFCQAAGGVLVGFVIKHCGNVEKSFAVVFGMIITALLETHYNDKPFGMRGLIAIVMVAVATVMYTMYPPPQTKEASSSQKVTSAPQKRSKKSSAVAIELEPFLAPSSPNLEGAMDSLVMKQLPQDTSSEARRLTRTACSSTNSSSDRIKDVAIVV